VKVARGWTYLYRAVDSAGETIGVMLSPKRDLVAAKLFLQLASSGRLVSPRVINVDGHPAYARAITELKQSGELGRRCRCRPSPYMNNIIEQDHRFIKKRIFTMANHAQFAAKMGSNKEAPTLQGIVPTYFTTVQDWLAKRIRGFRGIQIPGNVCLRLDFLDERRSTNAMIDLRYPTQA